MIVRVFFCCLFLCISLSGSASNEKFLYLELFDNSIKISPPDNSSSQNMDDQLQTSFITMERETDSQNFLSGTVPLYNYLRYNQSDLILNIADDNNLLLQTNSKEVRVKVSKEQAVPCADISLHEKLRDLKCVLFDYGWNSTAKTGTALKDELFFLMLLPDNQKKIICALEGDSGFDSGCIKLSEDCCMQGTSISSGVVLIDLLRKQGDRLPFRFKEISPPGYDDFCRSGDVHASSSYNSAPIRRVEEGSKATVVQSKRCKINVNCLDVFLVSSGIVLTGLVVFGLITITRVW